LKLKEMDLRRAKLLFAHLNGELTGYQKLVITGSLMELSSSTISSFACDDLLEELEYKPSLIKYVIEPKKSEKPTPKQLKTKSEIPKRFYLKVKKTFRNLTGGLSLLSKPFKLAPEKKERRSITI
jgi:hypothetical protein